MIEAPTAEIAAVLVDQGIMGEAYTSVVIRNNHSGSIETKCPCFRGQNVGDVWFNGIYSFCGFDLLRFIEDILIHGGNSLHKRQMLNIAKNCLGGLLHQDAVGNPERLILHICLVQSGFRDSLSLVSLSL